MARAKLKQPAWWLEEGSEPCPACNHAYVHRTEFYCVDCDGPVCPVCVEVITIESLCPQCFTTRSTESEVAE